MKTYTFTPAQARKIARYFPSEITRELIRAKAKEAGKGGTVEIQVEPGFAGGSIQLGFACLKAGVKIPR